MSDHACASCLYVCEYSFKQWVSISGNRFCVPHILFLLNHYGMLNAGTYPKEPSAYIDVIKDVQHSSPKIAPFQNVADLRAELNWRIDQCFEDGNALIVQVCVQGRTVNTLSEDAYWALRFVGSGVNRRYKKDREGQFVMHAGKPIYVEYKEWKNDQIQNLRKKYVNYNGFYSVPVLTTTPILVNT